MVSGGSSPNPKWSRNDEAAREDRLVGAKKTAVTVILDLPTSVRDILMGCVSEFGFEGPCAQASDCSSCHAGIN